MIQAVECHAGEPMRVITGGVPIPPGDSVYAQMKWLEKNDDQLRKLMLREPRGYPAMCCNLVVPPKDPRAAMGYIIMEQTEYCLMSGGNTMAVATVLLETGMIKMQEPVTEFYLEAPAGLIHIKAECKNGKVKGITFKNVPSYVAYQDKIINVPTLGEVAVDIVWGGAWFVMADYRQFPGLKLESDYGAEITRISALLIKAAQEQCPVSHPDYPDTPITLASLTGPSDTPGCDSKSAVTVLSGEVDFNNSATWTGALDRSCCGTGTCAKMAYAYVRGQLSLNQPYVNENILGLTFTGTLVEETLIDNTKALVPTVKGEAFIYGYTNYVLDAEDPFTEGYTLGDLWG
jgi:proline racemase